MVLEEGRASREHGCVPSEVGKESFEGGGGGVYEEWQGEQMCSLYLGRS